MGWPGGSQPAASGAPGVDPEAARDALAAIFAPSNAPLVAAALPSSRPPDSQPSQRGGGEEFDDRRRRWWWWWSPRDTASDSGSDRRGTHHKPAPVVVKGGSTRQSLPTMDDHTDCPLAGYRLDSTRGIIDEYARPRRVLNTLELRQLITDVAAIEQRAKCAVDEQFGQQMGRRSIRGAQFIVNPIMIATGIYLMTWKSVQLYSVAIPRRSVVLDMLLRVEGWRHPAADRDRVVQRYRRLLQATNMRVTMNFVSGLCLLAVGLATRPAPDLMENAPEIQEAKGNLAYQQHSEATLKWLWFVLFHHPAYAAEAKGSVI